MNAFNKGHMGRFSLLFLLLLASTGISFSQKNADDVLGVWLSGSGKGRIKIYKHDNKYFGKLVWLKEPKYEDGTPKVDKNNPDDKLKTRPLLGLVNLRDFIYEGEGKYAEGNIYDPENGSDYSCKMTLTDYNTLEVRGFIGVSLFGRTDVWKRQVKK